MKQKTSDRATLSWIISVSKGKKRFIWLLLVIQVIQGLASMGYALFLSGLVDCAVAGDAEGFVHYCLSLVGLVLFQLGMKVFARYLDEYTRTSLENSFKHRLFGSLLKKDYAAVTATHSGEWMNRLTSDTSVVCDGLTQILPTAGGMVARILSGVIMLCAFAPGFGVFFIVGGVVLVFVTWGLRSLMKQLHRQVQAADGRLRIFLSERLSSMMILRAFEQEDQALAQGDGLMAEHKAARMKKNHVSNLLSSGFSAVVNCVYIAGAVYCGYGILTHQMSYGTFTAVLQLVSQTQMPIANISAIFPKYSAMLASAERLMEADNYAEESAEPAKPDLSAFYREAFQALGLRNASFSYLTVGTTEPGEEPRRKVLRNLDMQINKGEYVAFCGPSGCGKSTVLKLLMCLYGLDDGQRYVLGREGEEPLTAGWRGLFSYVPQGNQLMSGTIREVVTFGDEAKMVMDEKIHRALEIACADQFLAELPNGLDTMLGERGAGLSEGQMQRIAIARAIFSDRPILLLDEATSALDEDTEARLLQNLRSMTDKTVIIVTHRPAALDITDKIIHFEPTEE